MTTTVIHYDPRMANLIREQIAACLEQAGITQRELARRTGIHQPNINRFLNGHAEMTSENLEKLAAALGATIKVVMGRKRATPAQQKSIRKEGGSA